MTVWGYFNEHWFVAIIALFLATNVVENVLTVINNIIKVHAAKRGISCNDSNVGKSDE